MQGESNSSKSRNAEDEACARELLVLGGRAAAAAAAKKGKAAAAVAASSAAVTSISNVKLASSKNKHQVPQSPGIATHIVLDNSEIMNGNAIMDDTFTFITGDSDTSAGSLSMASMEPTLNSAILTTTTDTKAGQRIVMHLPPSGHHANGGNLSHHHQSFAHALDGNLTDAESSDEDESNVEQDSKPKKAVVSGDDAASVSVQQESSSTGSHSTTGSGSSSVANVTNAITGSSSSQQASSGLLDLSTPKLSDTSTEDVDENQPIDYSKKTLSCSSSSSSNNSSSSSINTSANSSLVSPNNLASKSPGGKPSGSSSGSSSFKILSVESLLSRSPPRSKLQHHSTTKQLESASKTTPYHPENTDTIAGKSSDPKVQVQKTKVVLEPTPSLSSGDPTTALKPVKTSSAKPEPESSSPPKSVKDAALRKPEPQPLSVKPSPSAPPAKPETEISAVAGLTIPSKPEVEKVQVKKASEASPTSSLLPIVPPSIAGWSDDPPVVRDTKKAAPRASTDFQMPSAFAFGGSKISQVSAGMSLPVQPQTTLSHNPFSSRKPVVIEAKPLSVKSPSAPAKPETEMSAVAALPTSVKKPDSGKFVQPLVQSKVLEKADKGLPVDVDKSLPAASNKLQEPAIKVKDPVLPKAEPILPKSEPVLPKTEPVLPKAEPVLPKAETLGETFAKKPESKANIGPAATPSVLEKPKKPLSVKPSPSAQARTEPEISTVSKVQSHNPFSSRKPVVVKPEPEILTVSKAPDSNEIAVQNRTVKAVSVKQPASNVSKSLPAPVSSEIQIVLDPSNYVPKRAKVMPIVAQKTSTIADQTSSDERSKVSLGQGARVRVGEPVQTSSTSHGTKTVKPDVTNLSAKLQPEMEAPQPFKAELNLNESQSEKEQVQQPSFQPKGTVTSSFASSATNPPPSKKEVIESISDKNASSETKTPKKEGDKALSASPISGHVSLQSKEIDHRSEDLQGKYSLQRIIQL